MKVQVEVLGPLAQKPSPNPLSVELPAGSSVRDLLRAAGYDDDIAQHLVCLRGTQRLRPAEPLVPGDAIVALLHVGGG